jgi:hypothetical protein
MKTKFTNDRYKKSRGGYSRLLEISCEKCKTKVCLYQKDGPGILKRMYLDRIFDSKKYSGLENNPIKNVHNLECTSCKQILGVPILYKKEDRPAYRLFVGAVHKQIIKSSQD